jgi:hypothetical protein
MFFQNLCHHLAQLLCNFAEKRRTSNRRVERAHGPEFWRIYSALCCKATLMGLYNDELISEYYIKNRRENIFD